MDTVHRLNPTILREYDIRGIVGDTLTENDVRTVGRAFGTMIVEEDGGSVAVGFDGRLSSPDLEKALVEGLSACGLVVRRVGRGPTPMLYFANHVLKTDAAVMITGSHNPPEYNGIKMVLKGRAIYGAEIQKIGQYVAAGRFAEGRGHSEETLVDEAYVARLVDEVRGERRFSVAWDPGNGAAGEILRRVCDKLPGRHVIINEAIDGTFPNHHPDPTVEKNLTQLRKTVATEKCDLGIAFDGDGDRIGVVDSQGRILWGDQLLALYAADVLKDQPGATIIADVKASQMLFDEVARLGGNPLMWRTGHSLIKAKMAETQAPLAGEMSGHIFFKHRYYGYDDALYAAVRLIDLLSCGDDNLDDLRDRLPEMVNTPELRFPCSEDRKFAVIKEVRTRLKDVAGIKVYDIDGVRVRNADGWWLLRASNTQDVLVARCEAADAGGLERLKTTLVEQLARSGVAFPDFD